MVKSLTEQEKTCSSMRTYKKLKISCNGNLNITLKVGSKKRFHGMQRKVEQPLVSVIMNCFNGEEFLREAIDSGCDEALLLDNEGYVAEGSGENVFMIKDGVINTPELTSCLPGITRDTILVFARELGLPLIERRITRDEFYVADEAFFTGTAAEVLPIRSVDGRIIGDGQRGKITERLQSLYFDQVRGKREEHPEWHAFV